MMRYMPETRSCPAVLRQLAETGNRILSIAPLVLATYGCAADAPARPELIEVGAPVRFLGDTTSFGWLTKMELVEGHLVVGDVYGEYAIHVIDRNTGQIVNRLGPRGEGPGEVKTIWTLFRDASDSTRVWTFDYENQRFTLWDVFAPQDSAVVRQFRFLGRLSIASRPVLTPVGLFTIDAQSGHALGLYDSTGATLLANVGPLPFDSTSYPDHPLRSSPSALAEVNDFLPVLDPSLRRMALLYRRAARMDVVPLVERPTISAGPAGELTPPALGHGNVDFETHSFPQSATERFVYALYCGCDPRRGRDHEKDYVSRVYDWRANRVVDYQLDRYVGAITVSPDDSILYGAIEDPALMVAEWILPATLRNRRD